MAACWRLCRTGNCHTNRKLHLEHGVSQAPELRHPALIQVKQALEIGGPHPAQFLGRLQHSTICMPLKALPESPRPFFTLQAPRDEKRVGVPHSCCNEQLVRWWDRNQKCAATEFLSKIPQTLHRLRALGGLAGAQLAHSGRVGSVDNSNHPDHILISGVSRAALHGSLGLLRLPTRPSQVKTRISSYCLAGSARKKLRRS